MKLQSIYLLLFPAILSISGCSDTAGPDNGTGPVPVELRVSGEGLQAVTKATGIIPFSTTVFATIRQGNYAGLSGQDEWIKNTTVAVDGSLSLPGDPCYPETGAWLYLVATSPQVSEGGGNDGTVLYTLDGRTDLMYAKEIKGNRWDGFRFSNNTNGNTTPLNYAHLLTKLTFKAKKEGADGLTVAVNKITINKIKNVVQLNLSTGEAVYSGEVAQSLTFSGVSVNDAQIVPLDGALLLPPPGETGYKVTVETSSGTFTDVPVDFGSSADEPFQKGHSYEITLNIGDQELGISSVSVATWTPTENGNLDLIK